MTGYTSRMRRLTGLIQDLRDDEHDHGADEHRISDVENGVPADIHEIDDFAGQRPPAIGPEEAVDQVPDSTAENGGHQEDPAGMVFAGKPHHYEDDDHCDGHADHGTERAASAEREAAVVGETKR